MAPGTHDESFSGRLPAPVLGAKPRPASIVSLAHQLCDNGRAAEAEEVARWILVDHPLHAAAQVALARALHEQGLQERATEVLELAIHRAPGSVIAHRWLGEVLIAQQDWRRAREVIAQGLILSPDNLRLQQLMTRVRRVQNERAPQRAPARTTHSYGEAEPTPVADLQALAARASALANEPAAAPDAFSSPSASPAERTGEPEEVRITGEFAPHSPAVPGLLGALNSTPSAQREADTPRLGPPGAPAKTTSWWRAKLVSADVATVPPLDAQRPRSRRGVLVGLVLLTLAAGAGAVGWLLYDPRPPPERAAGDTGSKGADLLTPMERLAQAERAAASGDAVALRAVLTPARRSEDPRLEAALAMAAALLWTEHGGALDDTSLRRLARAPLPERGRNDDAAATHSAAVVLAHVAAGKLDEAQALLGRTPGALRPPALRFAEARLRQRQGDLRGAGTVLGPADTTAGGPSFRPIAFLRAELALDTAQPEKVADFLRRRPGDDARADLRARALQAEAALAEARGTLPATLAGDCERLQRDAEAISPEVSAHAAVLGAVIARLGGERASAAEKVTAVEKLAPRDPRTLALGAAVLANLGETTRAAAFLTRAASFARPVLPGLAWARLGGELAAAQPPAGDATARTLTELPLTGPETRLLAARAALSALGIAGLRRSPALAEDARAAIDVDLRWFALLASLRNDKAARQYAARLFDTARDPGPVGAYVAGVMAGTRRHLALEWLRKALRGHGDACRAAALYARILTELGDDPSADEALRASDVARCGVTVAPESTP